VQAALSHKIVSRRLYVCRHRAASAFGKRKIWKKKRIVNEVEDDSADEDDEELEEQASTSKQDEDPTAARSSSLADQIHDIMQDDSKCHSGQTVEIQVRFLEWDMRQLTEEACALQTSVQPWPHVTFS